MGKAKFLVLATFLVAHVSFGMDAATFERELTKALNDSDLTPAEKVDHVLNRLGFGPHPEILPADQLLGYDPNGNISAAKTHTLIKDYIVDSLAPRSYNYGPLEELVGQFPDANLSYAEICRKVVAFKAQIKALEGDPTKEAQLIAKRKAYNQFRSNVVNAERARLIAYAVSLRNPLAVRLHYLWFNRFNVAWEKTSFDLPDYFKRINNHTFGNFEHMLKMTAKHPAMLVYLDNHSNFEKVDANGNIVVAANENYAREVMELHTLGYSGLAISDIYQAARVLAGWGVDSSLTTVPYRTHKFTAGFHTAGPKRVAILGKTYNNANGQLELDPFLTDLAHHSRTATSVARMLFRHFVHDSVGSWTDPVNKVGWNEKPISLALAADFNATGGDLLSAYRTLFSHPDFWKRENYRTKVKDPLSLVVSVLRGTGKSYLSNVNTRKLTKPVVEKAISTLKDMNQDLFACSPPTGYPDNSWLLINSSFLLNFIRYVHNEATYDGFFADNYQDAETDAAAKFGTATYSPTSVLNAFFRTYRTHPDTMVVPLPRETSKADSSYTVLNAANRPDRYLDKETKVWGARFPIRSIASQIFGRAAFMNR